MILDAYGRPARPQLALTTPTWMHAEALAIVKDQIAVSRIIAGGVLDANGEPARYAMEGCRVGPDPVIVKRPWGIKA